VIPSLAQRTEALVRASAGQLRQGLIEVLTASDRAPEPRSPAGRVATAVATWVARTLLLLVALLLAINLLRAHRLFVGHQALGSGSVFDPGRLKTTEDIVAFSLLLLCARSPLLAWRIAYVSAVIVPYLADGAVERELVAAQQERAS